MGAEAKSAFWIRQSRHQCRCVAHEPVVVASQRSAPPDDLPGLFFKIHGRLHDASHGMTSGFAPQAHLRSA